MNCLRFHIQKEHKSTQNIDKSVQKDKKRDDYNLECDFCDYVVKDKVSFDNKPMTAGSGLATDPP